MKLRKLDLEEFLARVKVIDQRLSKEETAERFLDEALADFPAAQTLLGWMQKIAGSKKVKNKRYRKLLRTMERDFLVLLALRDIEKEESVRKTWRRALGDEEGRPSRRN